MQTAVPLACFLSVIRPPGVQYENSLLQIAPVDKSKCPFVKGGNDVAFQLFTRHNPIVSQDLTIGDDEKLFASNIDFHDYTVLYFHAWMETPEDGSAVQIREAYMQRGDTNVIMVDARTLQAGPWYFTAAQNTWYVGRFAGQFIDYLVTRGLNLNSTHLLGHSLGAHAAGVAGGTLQSGKVARITGMDPALPLFEHLPLRQRLDPTDAHFVDAIHTDAGIFGYKVPLGHVDFYPNAGISPQPGCELEVVIPQQLLLNKFFCSHWRSYQFYAESVIRPIGFKATECSSWREYKKGACAYGRTIHMGLGADTKYSHCINHSALSDISGDERAQTNGFFTYYLQGKQQSTFKTNSLEYKLEKLFNFIQAVRAKEEKKDSKVTLDRVRDNIGSLYDFKDSIIEYMKDYDSDDKGIRRYDEKSANENITGQLSTEIEYIPTKLSITEREKERKKDNIDIDKEIVDTLKNSRADVKIIKDIDIDEDRSTKVERIIKKQLNSDKYEIEDQIAEESGVHINGKTDIVQFNKETKGKNMFDIKVRRKRDTDLSNLEVTVVSGNLTLKEDTKYKIATTEGTVKINIENKNNEKKSEAGSTTTDVADIEDDDVTIIDKNVKKNEPKPFKIDIFKRRPLLELAIRLIPRLSKMRKEKANKNNVINKNKIKIPPLLKITPNNFKFRPLKKNSLRRHKRFASLFRRDEDSNNILFRMLDFLIKNRKNVLPVFTVVREINTLVKSANGELNHVSKESNNYIGATPPAFTPITYSLELGNENRMMSFVRRLFGLIPKGDRLTINAK